MEPTDKELSEAQQAALQEQLRRGASFEDLIRSEGWGFVKAYYENKIKIFATKLLVDDKTPIEAYEAERRELIGLRKMVGMIDNDIQALRKHEEEAQRSAKK